MKNGIGNIERQDNSMTTEEPVNPLKNESEMAYPFPPSPSMERGLGGEVKGRVIKNRSLSNIRIGSLDKTTHEKTQTIEHELFQINAHGLRPTTSNESFDMALADNSFQIKMQPFDEIKNFVESYFLKGKKFIHAIGKDMTPCYLFEPEVIRKRAKAFKHAFQRYLSDTEFYFAVKSNNYPDVSQVVLSEDFGLDVSSGDELQMALDLGANNIIFSGPAKMEVELDLAIANRDKVIVLMDSLSELRRLEKRAALQHKVIRVGMRLNPDPTGLWKKFGIPLNSLKSFIQAIEACDHLHFQGLQFHSSWNLGPERQVAFIKELGEALATLSPLDRKSIKFIDIGGGYWPEQGEWLIASNTQEKKGKTDSNAHDIEINRAASIDEFAQKIYQAICEHIYNQMICKICFEPGRWICNDAMHIIVKVMDKKYDDIVITDGATNAVGWERFETDYFPVLNLSQPAIIAQDCLILGSLCTPHDIWGYHYWGKKIKEGDILMIPTQGAYTYSLRQHFIKEIPKVISFP